MPKESAVARGAGDTSEQPPAELPAGVDERLMAVILSNMFDGVMLARASDGMILFTNPRFSAMFGYAPGELEGLPVSVLNAPGTEAPEEVAGRIIAALQSEGVWSGEVENLRKNGTRFWCVAKVTAFEHPYWGHVWVTVQLDITARKRAEAERQRSEKRLGLVLEATDAGAWDWNLQTGEVYFSPYWIASLGYAAEDVLPDVTFWERLVHPEDLPRVRSALAEHFAGRTPAYECVTRLRRKDGTWRWNLDRGRVVEWTPDGQPLRMVGTDTDLSDQRWTGLREFIAICAGCKKIRDESGNWHPLEQHFGERSRVQFSHGLCQDCLRKYTEGLMD